MVYTDVEMRKLVRVINPIQVDDYEDRYAWQNMKEDCIYGKS